MSQRQKKRNAQFKKKYFDAKSRDQNTGGKKERQQNPVVQSSRSPHQPATVETEEKIPTPNSPHLSSENDIKTEDVKKYSRRKVASNWDRYEDDDGVSEAVSYTPETEEQRHLRLVQLLNLPQVPQENITWSPTSDDVEREEGDGVLSLNLAELAESLNTLPTHKRLDISSNLLRHYGVNEDDLMLSDRENVTTPTNIHSKPPTVRGGRRGVTSLLSTVTTESFDFIQPGKKVDDKQPHSLAGESTHTDTHDELDSLLMASSITHKPLQDASERTPHPSTEHTSLHHSHLQTPSSHSSSHPPSSHPPPLSNIISDSSLQQPLQLPSADELDDMLDDLLSS